MERNKYSAVSANAVKISILRFSQPVLVKVGLPALSVMSFLSSASFASRLGSTSLAASYERFNCCLSRCRSVFHRWISICSRLNFNFFPTNAEGIRSSSSGSISSGSSSITSGFSRLNCSNTSTRFSSALQWYSVNQKDFI